MKYLVWGLLFFGSVQLISGQEQEHNTRKELDALVKKGIGFLYTEKDSLIYYFEAAFQIAHRNDYLTDKLDILTYLSFCSDYHYDLNKVSCYLKKTDSILKNDPAVYTLHTKGKYKNRLLFDYASYHYKIKDTQTSLRQFEELLNRLENTEDTIGHDDRSKMIYLIHDYIAGNYEYEEKYEQAKLYYNKNLEIGNKNRQIATEVSLSSLYFKEKKYEESIKLAKKTLQYYTNRYEKENQKRFKNTIISIQKIITKSYIAQKKLDSALGVLEQSKKYYLQNDPFQRTSHQFYGDIFLQKKEYAKAEKFYREYLTQTHQYFYGEKHQDLAQAYANLGNVYASKKEPLEALKRYQKALTQLSLEFSNQEDFNSFPEVDKVFSKQMFVKVLSLKLKALNLAYVKYDTKEYLEIANRTSYQIIKAVDAMKPEFQNQLDKEFLVNNVFPSFNLMIKIAYALYEEDRQESYLKDAFYFFEKSKGIYLLEAVRKTQAQKFGLVPNEIVVKEKIYQSTLHNLEKEIFRSRDSLSKNTKIKELYEERDRYYDFIEKIEKKYPSYYDLKYNSEVISLDKAKKEVITKDQGAISYFVTPENVYTISITKKGASFEKFPIDKRREAVIKQWYKNVTSFNYQDVGSSAQLAKIIYESYVKEAIPAEVSSLLIIPDRFFHYIPFGGLSKSNLPEDYLINDYAFSYANSLTLYSEQQLKYSKTTKMAVFAPVFKAGSANGQLLHNTDEAQKIVEYFDGRLFVDNQASIENFKEISDQYKIIHLATHGFFNDTNPDYSYLSFSKGETSVTPSDKLFVKDLYSYQIDADMVTLSACQTGFGSLKQGEGMLSMERGFFYAGVSSLTTTFWKVDDKTTAVLMRYYYDSLKNGLSKDRAIAQAKRKYLQNTEDPILKDPYYWAGFKVSGSIKPISSSNKSLLYGFVFFLVLGTATGVWFFAKKRKTRIYL
ncbi:CHAT domain-containing protein [Aquimarina sp. D1M17]|uniref:CHAT domain-containing protein n=1 Tax=Aquimarina acroporae TaxID=2937283 RepID=UPI0020BDA8A9|nr:CHAT domain-containing tetratricopeptide repeat protein [Aquimarina acroporae]MCK8522616.1 CHAT domain-containing protein [Aquimarina acroporae]